MTPTALMERGAAADVRAGGAEPTLDALFVETWSELLAQRATECPLCGETMAPVYSAHARPVGGRCTACGTELR